ncbi:MAG TPA: tripartite tricarboxylate transporter substrate binding protein [Casimicrobiaceae bacterium]|nr:tripartite tricarboxylate transporter substrate binding protein [Casimicrobiaceae bacterium]
MTLCVALFAWLPTAAQLPAEYPSRPIRIIVPSAPGGAGDVIARFVGEALATELHATVIVENRAGGSGVIGNDLAANAPPDGYTLLFATSATHIISAHAIAKLPYDPLRDFVPVINVGYATSVVVVNSALPIASLQELIAYARAHPGELNYASSGTGSANHIDTEVFASLAGIRLTHVPYRGTADGYRALLNNEVQLMFGAITSALPYIEAGRVRPLVVLVDRRSPLLPDVPTIAQAGLPSVDVRKWLGLVAPAATPPRIVERLNRTLDAILHEPKTRSWMDRQGLELAGGSASDFDAVLRADFAKWDGLVRRLGLRPE